MNKVEHNIPWPFNDLNKYSLQYFIQLIEMMQQYRMSNEVPIQLKIKIGQILGEAGNERDIYMKCKIIEDFSKNELQQHL